jgi:hypothetical protein
MGEDYIEGDYTDTTDTGTDTTFDPVEFDWSSLPTDEDVTNVMVEDQYQNWEDFYAKPENQKFYKDVLTDSGSSSSVKDLMGNAVKYLGDAAGSFVKNYLYDPKTGKFNPAGIVTAVTALKALSGGDKAKSTAYQGSIPNLAAVQQQVNYNDTNRVPGSQGRSYFTDTQYVDPSKVGEAQTAAAAQAQGILSGYKPAAAEVNPYAGKFAMPYALPSDGNVTTSAPASGVASVLPVPNAADIIKKAGGGMTHGRYLQGTTDGMADKIPSSIDGKQKAALSHGEFVIPADVVSHLGNGNSDAGAKKLYEMMARVRKARTGNPEQGKQIDPNKFVPGGQVGFAAGGIAHFVGGGEAGSSGTTSTGTGVNAPAVPDQGSSVATGLSSWAGPYVSNYLGKGQALSNQPYQAYTGPLTAGASDLQQQQQAGLSDIAKTGYSPTQFKGGIFDTTAAQQYMNPYLSSALDPQLQELRRQGQVTNLGNQAQATKMGAFGGSGSTLMQTEGQRNVLDKMQQALGQGYNTAYDKAMAQYNADQTRGMQAQQDTEASRQFGANYGLSTLDKLGAAGATQRDIEQQGLTADKAQFEEQRDFPYKQVQFQKSLLTGLPITTTDTTPMQSDISKISNQISGLTALYDQLSKLGQVK